MGNLGQVRSEAPWRGPLFVVGVWRSGTSLLYALLNKHPQIALLYEADLFLLRPLFWVPRNRSRRLERWEFWNQAIKRHGLDSIQIASNMSYLSSAMGKAYQEYARQKGALIWGEKSPNYYDSLGRLARHFPGARFIIIWREPAAICDSLLRAAEGTWFGRSGMTHRALMGYKALKTECDRLLSRGLPVHEVQYDALTTDPSGTMAEICKFLGLRFAPTVASLGGADRSAIYEADHHSLVRGERIVSSSERPQVLPTGLKRKIERYESLWWKESGGGWAELAASGKRNHRKPTLLERAFDGCAYRYFRTLDFVAALTFSFAPLPLLRAYRSIRHRHQASAFPLSRQARTPDQSQINPP